MLSKISRVPRELFGEILKSRRFANSLNFTLRVGDDKNSARASVSVSKKVSKSAVARNSIRRRVYTTFRQRISSLNPGLYLFVAKRGAEKVRGENLLNEMNILLKQFEKR